MSEKGSFNMDYLGITEDQIKPVDASESEVVSRQIMSRVKDIVATIRPDGISFNATCIRCMNDVIYIQIMIDRSSGTCTMGIDRHVLRRRNNGDERAAPDAGRCEGREI